jgi:hypothetical protein
MLSMRVDSSATCSSSPPSPGRWRGREPGAFRKVQGDLGHRVVPIRVLESDEG